MNPELMIPAFKREVILKTTTVIFKINKFI